MKTFCILLPIWNNSTRLSVWKCPQEPLLISPQLSAFSFLSCSKAHVGTSSLWLLVVQPWFQRVNSSAQRGAGPLASASKTYWTMCWTGRMNSWRVGGHQGLAGVTRVTAIQNLGSWLKGMGWKRIMLLQEKKGSCVSVAHKGRSYAASRAGPPKPPPSCSLVMHLFSRSPFARTIRLSLQQKANKIRLF